MNKILTIYLKEMMEVVRDRRTLIFMVVLPTLVIPIIFSVLSSFMEKQTKKAATETVVTALVNGDQDPDLVAYLKQQEGFEIREDLEENELADAVRDGTIKLGLIIPADAAEIREIGYQMALEAVYDNADPGSRADDRLESVLEDYSRQKRDEKLTALGVTSLQISGTVEPYTLLRQGIANKREMIGEAAGGMLPYLFIAFCFVGALYPAIDISAGEKERGTLETLLLTPVPRSYLVLGKFFVVMTTGLVSAILCVGSMGVWIFLKGQQFADELGEVITSITPLDLTLVGAMLIPLTALFATVLLSVAVYAKNFKEAQSYIAPFQFLMVLPAFISLVPGVELNWGWAMVPVTNISLAIKELVKGTVDYSMLVVIFASTLAVAGAGLAFCVHWFKREAVLFRN